MIIAMKRFQKHAEYVVELLFILSTVISWEMTNITHWGRDKIDAILQTTFSNAISWMKLFEFRLKFHWSLFLKVE